MLFSALLVRKQPASLIMGHCPNEGQFLAEITKAYHKFVYNSDYGLPDLRWCVCALQLVPKQSRRPCHLPHNKWQFADRPARMDTNTRTMIKSGR